MSEEDQLLPHIDKKLIEKTERWLLSNKKLTVDKKQYYESPRISSEAMDCSMPLTFDQYNFCSLGCAYCFAYSFKANNPSIKNFQLKSVDIERMIRVMNGEKKEINGNKLQKIFWEDFYSKKFLLHWGGLADPFCYFEKKNKLGLELIKELGKLNYPTLFSFKGDAILSHEWFNTFEKYSTQKNFAFQISMVTRNDKLAKLLEVGVPSPTKRLKIMRYLSEMGYYTILRLRPFIIGITDETLNELLSEALDCGIQGISMEFFAMDVRCPKDSLNRLEWIGKLSGLTEISIFDYYKKLSPNRRKTYQRLNRTVKEKYVKIIYKFCIKNNLVFACSDPDFKELNTSGSCCGMPDDYKDNELLENWNRNQLTYHLKELRKKYHKNNEIGILKFSEVYKDTPYFDKVELLNFHVKVISLQNAERRIFTLRKLMLDTWNNLRSSANPFNYFHGKLLPYEELDEEGNLQFIYNVLEYEDRWVREGVDLKK